MTERQYIPTADEPLLQLVADGDKKAFERLYAQYGGGLEKYIFFITRSKEATEEMIQDIFLSVWQKREQLPTLGSFRAYLYTIARNRVISWLRAAKARRRIVEPDLLESLSSRSDTDHRVQYNQYYKMVLDAIALLPERKREVFNLSLEQDLTLDEIAQRLRLSKSTVKQHLYSATTSIREYLRRHGQITATLVVFLPLFDY